MKRKNKLKSTVDFCFICGCELSCLEEKIGHRINPEKGNNEHNLLIVCKKCKKNVLNNKKIYEIELKNDCIDKYFANLSQESKKIVLNKIKIMKNKQKYGTQQ